VFPLVLTAEHGADASHYREHKATTAQLVETRSGLQRAYLSRCDVCDVEGSVRSGKTTATNPDELSDIHARETDIQSREHEPP
jgi:hypothetical protein